MSESIIWKELLVTSFLVTACMIFSCLCYQCELCLVLILFSVKRSFKSATTLIITCLWEVGFRRQWKTLNTLVTVPADLQLGAGNAACWLTVLISGTGLVESHHLFGTLLSY